MENEQGPRPYNTGLIAAMLTALAVAFLSGAVLIPAYKSGPATAYTSVQAISTNEFLALMRGMHHWGSAVLIVLGEVYIISGLFRGAYRKPGQWLWIGTILMFVSGLAMQITGHLLPYDVQAVRTAVVETGIAANAPVIGDAQANIMRAGDTVGPATLHLWYIAHIGILVILCLALLFAIPAFARKIGVSVGRWSWAFGSFVVVLALALLLRPPLGSPASAADLTDSAARPEWYILPLHSLLVIANNVISANHLDTRLVFIGTMVIPGLVMLLLIAMPWIHKREGIPVARALGTLGAICLVGLLIYSASDVAPAVGDQIPSSGMARGAGPIKLDPALVAQGRKLFDAQGCTDCHKVNGQGGKIGPDLSSEGSRGRSMEWQLAHLQNPKSKSPGSTMPNFARLPKDQLTSLAQYVSSLRR